MPATMSVIGLVVLFGSAIFDSLQNRRSPRPAGFMLGMGMAISGLTCSFAG